MLKLILKKLFSERLAPTIEEMEVQADAFLGKHGFPVTLKYRQIFGAFVQHLPPDQDYFFPKHLAAMIRKSEANEAAFYMINPKLRGAKKDTNDQATDTSEEVVQKA